MSMNNPCLSCGCWDSEREGCTMPSTDMWYACPIESAKPENREALSELVFGKYSVEEIKTAIEAAICAISRHYGENGLFVKRGLIENITLEFAEVIKILTDIMELLLKIGR